MALSLAISRNAQAGLIVVSTALACAACSANPAAHDSPSQRSGPLLTGTISVSGGATLTATFSARAEVLSGGSLTSVSASDTCANYADGLTQNPTSFSAPELQTAGGSNVYMKATIASDYHGPGTYSSETTPLFDGTLVYGIGFATGQNGAATVFRSSIHGIHGATTLTVRPDGSGSLEFSDWQSDEVRGDTGPAATVDGTVTWTCH
jgi:hypothetical protein